MGDLRPVILVIEDDLDLSEAVEEFLECEAVRRQQAVLDERARIAREMHDGLAKSLAGLALEASALERLLCDVDPAASVRAAYLAQLCRRLARQARDLIYAIRTRSPEGSLLERLQCHLVDWERTSG